MTDHSVCFSTDTLVKAHYSLVGDTMQNAYPWHLCVALTAYTANICTCLEQRLGAKSSQVVGFMLADEQG